MNLKKFFLSLLLAGLIGFLLWNILQNWSMLTRYPWSFRQPEIPILIISLFLIYPTNVFCWHLLTRAFGFNIPLRSNVKIWMFSNLARFLPGGFWQYPGRVYLLAKGGINKSQGAALIIIEALFVLMAGSLAVIISLYFSDFLPQNLKLIFVFILLCSFLIMIFKQNILTATISLVGRILHRRIPILPSTLPNLKLSLLAVFFLQFVTNGLVLFLLTRVAGDFPLSFLPVFIGIFAASWILGYLTIFAPGGLGVQEASIAGLLSFYIPFPVASVIAILFRLMILVSEVSILFFIFLSEKFLLDRQRLRHV